MTHKWLRLLCAVALGVGWSFPVPSAEPTEPVTIELPAPLEQSDVSIEQALWQRRSVRTFTDRVPDWQQVGQLLWAAQGINRAETQHRTSPSAGAMYPIEVYVILPQGFYHYEPAQHAAVELSKDDTRKALFESGTQQETIQQSPCVFIICAVVERTEAKYKERGLRYVLQETGHTAQNILLQLVSLGMGGVPIGGFTDEAVQQALKLPKDHQPLYIIATGFPKEGE